MSKAIFLDSRGFGVLGILVILVLLAGISGAGAYVYQRSHGETPARSSSNTTVKPSATAKSSHPSAPAVESQSYLTIKEVGIRFKLSESIKDAYYVIKSNTQGRPVPVVALYVHSLDGTDCAPAKTSNGVGVIATYTDGQADPVHGNFSETFPDAPLIGQLHYYFEPGQYDCTAQKAHDKLSAVVDAFQAAYPTIEAYPSN